MDSNGRVKVGVSRVGSYGIIRDGRIRGGSGRVGNMLNRDGGSYGR